MPRRPRTVGSHARSTQARKNNAGMVIRSRRTCSSGLAAETEYSGSRKVRADGERQVVNSTGAAARRTCAETAPQTLRTYRIENNSSLALTFASRSCALARIRESGALLQSWKSPKNPISTEAHPNILITDPTERARRTRLSGNNGQGASGDGGDGRRQEAPN